MFVWGIQHLLYCLGWHCLTPSANRGQNFEMSSSWVPRDFFDAGRHCGDLATCLRTVQILSLWQKCLTPSPDRGQVSEIVKNSGGTKFFEATMANGQCFIILCSMQWQAAIPRPHRRQSIKVCRRRERGFKILVQHGNSWWTLQSGAQLLFRIFHHASLRSVHRQLCLFSCCHLILASFARRSHGRHRLWLCGAGILYHNACFI
mmetsp:Transcript_133377/g.231671  ORF Transcript_133377/g.231671 Transcript_133377/m.231671 type:complete len:204 (+) Transcript_133377:2060-2671(+)